MRVITLILVGLLTLGCGTEDTEPNVNGGDVTTAGDTTDDVVEPDDSGGEDATESDEGETPGDVLGDEGSPELPPIDDDEGKPPTDGGKPPASACTGVTDAEIVANADLFDVALGCAPSCLGQGPECATACVETELGVTADCAGCVGGITDCAVNSCGQQCLGGVTPECQNCILNTCGPSFATCAGAQLKGPPPCDPECGDKVCGPDACGGTCGTCTGGFCEQGQCQAVSDACNNEDDAAAMLSSDPKAKSSECGLACISDPDITTCAVNCIVDGTGLTQDCAFCFGDHTGCLASVCLFDCFDPTTPACLACLATSCDPGFEACAGVPIPGGLQPPACEAGPDQTELAETDQKVLLIDCTTACADEADATTCANECVGNAAAFTTGCAGCFGAAVACLLGPCSADCAETPEAPACALCVMENCAQPFSTCAGASLVFPCEAECAEGSCGDDACGGSCGTCESDELCVDLFCAPLDNAWCEGDDDLIALDSVDVTAVQTGCESSCSGSFTYTECITGCLTDTLSLSAPCGTCMGNVAVCAKDACGEPCMDPTSVPCIECHEVNCAEGFEACAGLTFGDYYLFE